MVEPFPIHSEGERLDGILHLPGPGRWPCTVLVHGLLSSKLSDKYLLLADRLVEAGYACLRFDFRGCGLSGGKLAETTVAGRIQDLQKVLHALQDHPAMNGHLSLLGSSLGGYISLFIAAEEPRVRGTVLWATPAHLRDLREREEALRGHGLGIPFFQELHGGNFLEAPPGVSHCLIIHGDQDELIPLPHARTLYQKARDPKALEIIEGADHRLTDRRHREEAIRLSLVWFKRYLS